MGLHELSTDHGTIGWRDAGSGRPVVLVHGWGGNADQWQGCLPALGQSYHAFALQLPDTASVPALGGSVADMLAALDLKNVTLVGHSLGGPVAIEAALLATDRISGILGLDTLEDRTFYGGCDKGEIARRRAEFDSDIPGATRRMVRQICATDTPLAGADHIADAILRKPEKFLSALRDAMFSWRLAERLPKVTCPIRLLNSAYLVDLRKKNPIPELKAVPVTCFGAGHFPQIEFPQTLVPMLLAEIAALELDATT